MMATIPMSKIINVIPTVIGQGGSALSMSAVVLTQNATVVPAGTFATYPDLPSVVTAFGPVATTVESQIAFAYFASWTNSSLKPASIGFFGAVMTGGGGG